MGYLIFKISSWINLTKQTEQVKKLQRKFEITTYKTKEKTKNFVAPKSTPTPTQSNEYFHLIPIYVYVFKDYYECYILLLFRHINGYLDRWSPEA